MLRTTIYMRHDIFVTLGLAATKLGKTRRDIVVLLLMRLVRDIARFQGGFTLVRYQARDSRTRWHCFPITYRKHENEFFSDLRRLGKCSVSYLVAIAMEQFLDGLLQEKEKRHNYTEFTHYAIGQRTDGDVICWEFYWGDPADTPMQRGATRIHRLTRALGAL